MKIGIITFHWATNYGAILQAYALQNFLQQRNHEVQIINYRPNNFQKRLLNTIVNPRIWRIPSDVKDYYKEQKLEKFRDKYLNETICYKSLEDLQLNPPDFDVYICGSDQVWNPSFLLYGEGKQTPAYFINFGSTNTKRIAYAVSFGCEFFPKDASIIARDYISSFDTISVRENSGLQIVESLGYSHAKKLPDPTILLKDTDYIFENQPKDHKHKTAFIYVLRNENNGIKEIKKYLKKEYKLIDSSKKINPQSVEDWIQEIRSASVVLTNSYHGMIFSLIFHIPFLVVLAKGVSSGMNDRFVTLLSHLELEDRIIEGFQKDQIEKMTLDEIDWGKVDLKLAALRKETNTFFDLNL